MKKKLNEKDFTRMEIGEERAFPCIEESDGTHLVSSIKNGVMSGCCDFPMGTSLEVIPKKKRATKPTHDPAVVLHEVNVGDKILELDRFQDDKLYVRKYYIYDIQNNAVLTVGLDDEFFYRDEH